MQSLDLSATKNPRAHNTCSKENRTAFQSQTPSIHTPYKELSLRSRVVVPHESFISKLQRIDTVDNTTAPWKAHDSCLPTKSTLSNCTIPHIQTTMAFAPTTVQHCPLPTDQKLSVNSLKLVLCTDNLLYLNTFNNFELQFCGGAALPTKSHVIMLMRYAQKLELHSTPTRLLALRTAPPALHLLPTKNRTNNTGLYPTSSPTCYLRPLLPPSLHRSNSSSFRASSAAASSSSSSSTKYGLCTTGLNLYPV